MTLCLILIFQKDKMSLFFSGIKLVLSWETILYINKIKTIIL